MADSAVTSIDDVWELQVLFARRLPEKRVKRSDLGMFVGSFEVIALISLADQNVTQKKKSNHPRKSSDGGRKRKSDREIPLAAASSWTPESARQTRPGNNSSKQRNSYEI
ncbi:hypothetical protein BT93_L4815 [Corymbia citriodora subsp. variegata]|uniref:Uncharacterized protein n=1 Tax=Corymbia citriodora subsp. variegata TaxID=360336 RepID=A0A8T0CTK5_CORYI|nr:hypothetical protein BT93_L4815 [Corymbia citriodora subsp. variegata]